MQKTEIIVITKEKRLKAKTGGKKQWHRIRFIAKIKGNKKKIKEIINN